MGRWASVACLFLILVAVALAGCGQETGTQPGIDETDALWNQTLGPYLQDALWLQRDIYDAGHTLMVPLEVAFASGRYSWQDDFHSHFLNFMNHRQELDTGRLNRFHYFILAARYLVLCQEYSQTSKLPPGFFDYLHEAFVALWLAPAWHWRGPDFDGMADRLNWKLANTDIEPGYWRAITDEDKFAFAIAADLTRYCSLADSSCDTTLAEILDLAEVVYTTEVQPTACGGWILQPGVWTDHRDFAYAGNDSLAADIQPSPVPGIAPDSNHSHRDARQLQSLMRASAPGSDRRALYQGLLEGLTTQFLGVVLIRPPGNPPAVMLNNFMDGRNGVYRWGYATQGPGNGYGPCQLSGTFNLGWWSFLDDPRITALYEIQAEQFPLPQDVVDVYVGPNTLRSRHPLVTLPDAYTNGLYRLLTLLAAVPHDQEIAPYPP